IEDYSRGRKRPSPHPHSACWRARPVLGESRRVADQNWIPRHGLAPSGRTPCHPHQGKNRCEIRRPTLPALPSGSSLASRPGRESGCQPASARRREERDAKHRAPPLREKPSRSLCPTEEKCTAGRAGYLFPRFHSAPEKQFLSPQGNPLRRLSRRVARKSSSSLRDKLCPGPRCAQGVRASICVRVRGTLCGMACTARRHTI